MSHPIIELQASDTLTDQLGHRRSHLPEQVAVDAAAAALREWEQHRDALLARLAEFDRTIADSERQSHEIDVQRARLEKQLKTVIAPREAEALQHEIATLNERRSGLDDAELTALEESAAIDDQLTAHAGAEPALRGAVDDARLHAAVATAAIDAELAAHADGHVALRSAVDPALLRRYDELRRHHVVAAAELIGHRCSGCHLDLSATEIDEVKAIAAGTGLSECPHCGRLLVL